ncbi:hypothetical protein DY000_02014362 [Brassica cretica]|uniref:Uncharacterized protein n=1 Tax=Brassica cretica TaxID=69181 RepID=A0ABQ7DCI8_BRACR|nr:hypothetical protein DY000_02014362 [Brassica cretica]
MRPEACGLTHSRSGGAILLAGVFYIYSAPMLILIHPKPLKGVAEREVEKESKRFGAISRVLEHFRDQLIYLKSEEIVQRLEEALSKFRTVHSSPFEMSALGFG